MGPPSIRRSWRVPAALLAGLLAGSVLITPALGHIEGVTHTWNQHFRPLADPRYVNATEKAPNAELLDGQDSTAFLAANATAADSDMLDGKDSSDFMAGPGRVIGEALAIAPGNVAPLLAPPSFEIDYICPNPLSDNGHVFLQSFSTGNIDVFADNGSPSPVYERLGSQDPVSLFATSAAGEYLTLQIHSPTEGIFTIHVMSVHRGSDCHAQVQAVMSS